MRAVCFDGDRLDLREVPDPVPGHGEVLVRVSAVGLCHSDLTLMGRPREAHPFDLPLVLGHEVAGVVDRCGTGVSDVAEGEAVVVYGPWGCGQCRACATGAENHCRVGREQGILPPGLGSPGGLAELIVVAHARHLVAAEGVDATQAAPLTDAAATAYQAVRLTRESLVPGATAVVIGAGGLGHVAIQLLRCLTAAEVVAVDTSAAARALAADLGAHHVVDPAEIDPAGLLRSLTGGEGADVIYDFVTSTATLDTLPRMLARGGDLVVVGVGDATLPVAVGTMPLGATVRTPYWATRSDLADVVALAQDGRLRITVTEWPLDRVADAYGALANADQPGRAVVRPGWSS